MAQRYREIMVDEYQDANDVQNCIFSAVSRQEQNLFTVGDVKQSIYRFRLADPTIFLRKYNAYVPAGQAEDGQPRKVLLSKTSAPAKACWTAATLSSAASCPAGWARWTTARRSSSISVRRTTRPTRTRRRNTTSSTWPTPRRSASTARRWRPGSWQSASAACWTRATPSPAAMACGAVRRRIS